MGLLLKEVILKIIKVVLNILMLVCLIKSIKVKESLNNTTVLLPYK